MSASVEGVHGAVPRRGRHVRKAAVLLAAAAVVLLVVVVLSRSDSGRKHEAADDEPRRTPAFIPDFSRLAEGYEELTRPREPPPPPPLPPLPEPSPEPVAAPAPRAPAPPPPRPVSRGPSRAELDRLAAERAAMQSDILFASSTPPVAGNAQRAQGSAIFVSSEVPDPTSRLRKGEMVKAVLLNTLVSDQPGHAKAGVLEPVYDSVTRTQELIPAGSVFLGTYDARVVYGQSRLLINWETLQLPDGRDIELGQMPTMDSAGIAGAAGEVDNHYGRIAAAAAVSLFTRAAGAYITGLAQSGSNVTQVVIPGTADELSTFPERFVEREFAVPPTITVPQGTEVHVYLKRTLEFEL